MVRHMSFFPHAFEATVQRFGVGKTRNVWDTVRFLPWNVEGVAVTRFCIEGDVNAVPLSGAFIPSGKTPRGDPLCEFSQDAGHASPPGGGRG